MIVDPQENQDDGRIRRARVLREKRRAEIIRAAERVFAQKGYHIGSISDIIETAGVARGTFYLYFESKRAIFEVIVDSLLDQLKQVIRGVDVDAEETPASQLAGSIRRVLEIFHQNGDLTRILLQQTVGLDPEFDQKLADFYGSILQLIRSAIVDGMALGIVRTVDPIMTAHFMLGSVKEAMAAALLEHKPALSDLDALAWDLVQYNLQGVWLVR